MSVFDYLKNKVFQKPSEEGQPATNASSQLERIQQFINALGGVQNIETIESCITRLRLVMVDRNKVNENALNSLGSKGNVKIGEQGLQVILGPEASLIADAVKQLKA